MAEKTLTAFDLADPILETGRVVIEASAGTGKTYSLTVLVVRHVAERGVTADQLLMVTFTNAATAELREKTREQAQETLTRLRSGDTGLAWMATMTATDESRRAAIANLESFLSHFDDATITTIHGFCQIVLRRAGLNSPAPVGYEVRDNVDDIIDQVITDLYVEPLSDNARLLYGTRRKRKAAGAALGEPHDLRVDDVRSSLSQLRSAVVRAMGNPRALILPESAPSPRALHPSSKLDEAAREITAQAEIVADATRTVIAEVRRRCHDAGIITYDDMVRLVADTLDPPLSGDAADDDHARDVAATLASGIASQYGVIMVDEFQDTDASQWSIFSTVFAARPNDLTLITVGDPKQAIYRFRGADVQVYVDAVSGVSQQHALDTNWRSDASLLTALETLLSGTQFDASGAVSFAPVKAASKNALGALSSASAVPPYRHVPGAPLEIRYLANDPLLGANADKPSNNDAPQVRRVFWRDVANHVVELLTDGLLPDKTSDVDGAVRRIIPSDIAVLVNSHSDAETAVRYLLESKVPAVRLKTESVFRSQAAMQWLMLLGALANPGKPQFVRAYALSWFGGMTEEEIIAADDDRVADWQQQCARDADLLQRRGMTALYLSHRNRPTFMQRVLGEPDGERHITDLDHIAETLAALPRFAHRAGAAECYQTLSEMVDDSGARNEEHERRIEADDIAVKVMTIHASKGLQFPIVFLPTLMKTPSTFGTNPQMFSFHFPGEASSRRVIDVASGFDNAAKWIFDPTGNDDDVYENLYKNEYKRRVPGQRAGVSRGRDLLAKQDSYYDTLRLLYVAMTRAEHKVVVYWSATGGKGKENTKVALARVLAAHADLSEMPLDDGALDGLMTVIEQKSGGTIATIPMLPEKAAPLVWENAADTADLDVATARFSRTEPVRVEGFARWSYSGLAKALSGDNSPVAGTAGDLSGATDESNNDTPTRATAVDVPLSREEAIATMPLHSVMASPEFGNAVHEILDAVDPGADDIVDVIGAEVESRFHAWMPPKDRLLVSTGITGALHAPLGHPFAGNTLHSLGARHRLSELEFNFHLPQNAPFALRRIGELMLEHGNVDPHLAAYASSIAGNATAPAIAGFMNGFIDAVFRIQGDSHPVYVVADYKTNRLHRTGDADGNPLAPYHPDRLVEPMIEHGYVLQALVYSVALHRYLRWRQQGYDPDIHLGGASYLFMRGMTGAVTNEPTPRPFGVFHWRPATTLVLALNDLFAGKETA